MTMVKKLALEELKDFIEIIATAYPGFMEQTDTFKDNMEKMLSDIQENDPNIDLYGLYRESKLLGGMRLHHLTMNLYNKMVPLGGVGLVAVDLLHKKEKVAKEIIEYFLKFYQEKKVPLVALYPFRPDFYKKMGFGHGTKIYQYAIEPSSFPKGPSKKHVRYLTEADKELVQDCMNRYVERTHGMMEKTKREASALFKRAENKLVGYETDKGLEGYIVFSFKRASETNFVFNDLVIKEFVYENRDAFLELSTFLHSQADQFNRVHFHTQEEDFYYALFDPRNESNNLIPVVFHESHKTGVGLMYRVIDVEGMFTQLSHHRFGTLTCTVKFTIADNLIETNNKSFLVQFNEGKASLETAADAEVEVQIDISDFSSLLMNSVNFKSLYQYGLVTLSDERFLEVLAQAFNSHQRPVCMTTF